MRKILPLLFALVLSTVGFGQIANEGILLNKKSTNVVLKADPNSRVIEHSQEYREVDALTELTYFSEEANPSFVGLGEGAPINSNVMMYLPSSTVAEHTGKTLVKMSFLLNNSDNGLINSLKLRIWTDTTDINNPVYEQEVENVVSDWNEVTLTTPYVLGTEPLFLGYFISGEGYVFGAEEGVGSVDPNGYGDIIELNGGFSHLSEYGIGDVAIKAYVGELDSVSIKLESIDVAGSMLPDSIDVAGTVKNTGIDTIKSYDVTYVLNGDTSSVYSVAGVNIAAGATHQFIHDVKADLTQAGGYELKVIISNVNNSDKETNLDDNVLSRNINSILEVVQKKVLHELFTSSTCGPCATLNPIIDEVVYNNNLDKAVLIKYQVNWPGAGDPYYVQDAQDRIDYYGVGAVPSFFVDANSESPAYSQGVLDIYASQHALLKMKNGVINYNFDTKSLTADIDIVALSDVSGNLVAQMAVVEKKTTGNIGSNGETEFHNVMMKFIDNTNGNALSDFVVRDTQHVSATTSLASTNIEEITDIRVVVWVQDYDTKQIYQSEYIDLTQEDMIDVGLEKLETVNTACGGLPSDGEVKVTVVNTGIVGVSNFDVNYSLNGEQIQKYTYEETLAPGEKAEIVFIQDFSQAGDYNLEITSELSGDVIESNDVIKESVYNLTPAPAQGFKEDLDNPIGWTVENANGDDRTWIYINQPGSDGTLFGHEDASAFIYVYNPDAVTAADDYLYSRCIDFEAGKTYELSFWSRIRDAQYPEKLNVFIGDAPSKDAMTQQIVDLGTLSNASYQNSLARFEVPATGTYYIGFHAYSDADKWLLMVDDISISDVTSVNEIVDEVNIYPNPTNGLFRVEGVQGAKVVVYNIVGEVVYNNSNASENINIDLSSQKEGSYVVKITNDDKVSTHKIIVTK